jgi:hypothetical protein
MTLAYPYLYGTNITGAGQGSVATVTNGSRIVTGTGGAWTSALEQGDLFLMGGAIGLVEEIISDTELRLALDWTGATITDGAYVAMRGIAHTDPRNYGRKLGEYLVRVRDLPDPGDIGDVFGPNGGVVNNEVVLFDATTGKQIKASNGVTARARGSLQVDGQLDVLGPNIVMRGADNTHIRFRNADGSLQNAVICWDNSNRRIAIAIYNPDGVTAARRLDVGENLVWDDGSASYTIWHSGIALDGFVQGLTLSNNAADPNNKIDIAPGRARGNGVTVVNPTTITVALGAVAPNTTHHIHALRNNTTGGFWVSADVSPTSPDVPPGYTRVQRLGAILTDGSGNIRPFVQSGNKFMHNVLGGVVDYSSTSVRALAPLAVTVPNGVRVEGIFGCNIIAADGDAGVSIEVRDGSNQNVRKMLTNYVNTGVNQLIVPIEQFTNTTRQVWLAVNGAPHPSLTCNMATLGWIDYQIPRIGA